MEIDWGDVGALVLFYLCCIGLGAFGNSMKFRSRAGGIPVDRRNYLTGLYLGAGAGLVTGMFGHGLKVSKSIVMGTSVVIGYIGFPKFCAALHKVISAALVSRLSGREPHLDEVLDSLKDEGDDEGKDGDPP